MTINIVMLKFNIVVINPKGFPCQEQISQTIENFGKPILPSLLNVHELDRKIQKTMGNRFSSVFALKMYECNETEPGP